MRSTVFNRLSHAGSHGLVASEVQAVTTDKKSGIVNDANLWATETMGNAKYPLELFLRVITVSLKKPYKVSILTPCGRSENSVRSVVPVTYRFSAQ